MKRKYILATVIAMIVATVLCACSPNSAKQEDNGQKEQLTFTTEDGREVVTDKSIDYGMALMVTVNPEMLFYVDNDENILKIEPLNKDAEDVLENMNFTSGNFDDCYGDFLLNCYTGGYIKEEDTHEISLTVIDKGELTSVDYCEDVVDNAEEIVSEMGKNYDLDIYATSDIRVLEPARTAEQGERPSDDENRTEDKTCDLCGGVGSFNCENCNGSGVEIVIEHVVEEVRNDYVCPICGGKGWVDDGMHGGLTAECGNCTTSGGSGDFRDLAYDRVESDVEVEYPCHRCNGKGRETCNRCGGSGLR